MRFIATIGALLFTALIFVADSQAVHAQTQNDNKTEAKITVEVKKGDSLSKIGKQHDTTYRRLFDANMEIKDPDVIYPGDEVRIPHPEEELKRRPLQHVQPVSTPAPKQQVSRSARVQSRAPEKQEAKKQPVQYTPAPAPASTVGGKVWDRLAACESGGNWAINTGNGYYGGLQFTLASWRAVGGSGYPHQASKAEQIARGQKLQAIQGWGAWPACTAKLGIR